MNRETTARDRLIVALDVDATEASTIAEALRGAVRWVKVGMTLFYQSGPQIVSELRGMGFDVFLDLKLHDIPHQVQGAAAQAARLGIQMLTVHASGGSEMVEAAVRGAELGALEADVAPPWVVGVTVLTSMNDDMLAAVGVALPSAEQVPLLARVAHAGGAAGVVCSPHEAIAMRELLGADALVVTPGVRPAGARPGDQARVQSPGHALQSGASHLVIGRPITGADSPTDAVERIIGEMEEALKW